MKLSKIGFSVESLGTDFFPQFRVLVQNFYFCDGDWVLGYN